VAGHQAGAPYGIIDLNPTDIVGHAGRVRHGDSSRTSSSKDCSSSGQLEACQAISGSAACMYVTVTDQAS